MAFTDRPHVVPRNPGKPAHLNWRSLTALTLETPVNAEDVDVNDDAATMPVSPKNSQRFSLLTLSERGYK